ncbi:DNA-binding domain-containing protein [Thaumasiovibrio subtropicus]|uniref:HvfC/BufC N-terminal domain-containing protein n=1 Tax=Thaumasiovibrio subtropicus TaxID=1891207 RepID=UPI000B35C933|nr:DNA-binding domain-containing protein [Thaumasiovibrio subtropicus]
MSPLPNLSLQQLQTAFSESQHYREQPLLGAAVKAGQFTTEQRLQIYRNNFIISLSDVLEATYPICKAIVGDDCFQQLARQHVLSEPLTEGDVSHYGEGFDRSIRAVNSVHDAVPYLAALAELEWQIDRAQQKGALLSAFPIEALSQWLSENGEAALTNMHFVPHGFLFKSPFALGSLWQMVRSHQITELDLFQPETCWIQHRSHGTDVLIFDEASEALINLSLQQKTLAEADEGMLAMLPELIQKDVFATFEPIGRE